MPRWAKALVGVDDETVPYTFGTPAVGDTFPAYDVSVTQSGDNNLRKESKPHFGRLPEIPGLAEMEISFKIPWVGGTGLGVQPYWVKALMGCGYQAERTVGTNCKWRPWSTYDAVIVAGPPILNNPYASYSVAVWIDNVRYALKGGMGNVVWNFKTGEPIELAFTFKGAYQAKIDEAAPAATSTAIAPQVFLNAALTLQGGYSPVFESFSLDTGNEFGKAINGNDVSGLKGYTIINRRTLLKVNPEDDTVASHNFNGIWRAGTQGAVALAIASGAAGNKIALSVPTVQYHAPQLGNREGQVALDVEMAAVTTGVEGSDFTFTNT